MPKKKKTVKRRNGVAKALQSPTHRQRVIPDSRMKAVIKAMEKEFRV